MSTLGDVLVLGLGSSGLAAARYCLARVGAEVASVTVADAGDDERLRELAGELAALGARVMLGVEAVPGDYQLCIASPGIAPHTPLFRAAEASSAETISELEFAYRRSDNVWVAVTGTNGKTTTTSLVTHLLRSGGVQARSVGNIGTVAISAVEDAAPGEVLVAEASSFQLALTESFHPRVAVVLNITPDHLDWHGSMERYAEDKARVLSNLDRDDTAVIDADDLGSAALLPAVRSRGVHAVSISVKEGRTAEAHLADGELVLTTRGGTIRLGPAEELQIKGLHNVSNALAAAAAAHALGVNARDLQAGLRTFAPIPHRLEPVGEFCGAEWFNDSKATNPDAVFKAISAFAGRPFVLLLGGRNKANDFRLLAEEARRFARHVIAFGEARSEIAEAFGEWDRLHEAEGLESAVRLAAVLAESGDAVVLSPACASFDEFRSYEHRGDVFRDLVSALEDC